MYGVKRIEYDEYHNVSGIEFYPDIPAAQIAETLILLGLLYRETAKALSNKYQLPLHNYADSETRSH